MPYVFANINTADRHFLKYLPDNFLNEMQKKAKQAALEEDRERIEGYRNETVISPDGVLNRIDEYWKKVNRQMGKFDSSMKWAIKNGDLTLAEELRKQQEEFKAEYVDKESRRPENGTARSSVRSNLTELHESFKNPGIHINDSGARFTDMIFTDNEADRKTMETRVDSSGKDVTQLDGFIGKRVTVIRTGRGKAHVGGYVTIKDKVVFNTEEEFRAAQDITKYLPVMSMTSNPEP